MTPMTPQISTIMTLILVANDKKNGRTVSLDNTREKILKIMQYFVVRSKDKSERFYCRRAYEAHDASQRLVNTTCNMNMPRMNGVDGAIEIRADASLRTLPMIILPPTDFGKQIIRACANGAKPSHSSDVVDLLIRFGAYWLESAGPPVQPDIHPLRG